MFIKIKVIAQHISLFLGLSIPASQACTLPHLSSVTTCDGSHAHQHNTQEVQECPQLSLMAKRYSPPSSCFVLQFCGKLSLQFFHLSFFFLPTLWVMNVLGFFFFWLYLGCKMNHSTDQISFIEIVTLSLTVP